MSDWVDQRLARLDETLFQPDTERAWLRLKDRRGSRFTLGRAWLMGAAAAATACACLLIFPTSQDVVRRLFSGSDSKLVYVGQVYADLKTMKDKQPEIDFTLPDAAGQPVRLSARRGKVVLLNFWATWCEGCKTEIPWLVEFEQKYRDKGLAVVGVSEDADGWKSVKPYLKQAGLNYTVVLDTNGSVAKRYALFGMPVTYLIDRDGQVSAASVGIVNKTECEAEIVRLLGNGEPLKQETRGARDPKG